jgi:hypothetical protein
LLLLTLVISRVIYYNSCKTPTCTQSSLTNKALLIKYFVVFSLIPQRPYNHDPKGGCVLLNDGTVKFIRTKEELQQL